MGRELQKKKRRSGRQPVRRPPSNKNKILNNPIIRENWNKAETLSQNYRRIGLVSKLNKRAGGVQKRSVDAVKTPGNPFAIQSAAARATNAVDEVVLRHDKETGEVVVAGGKRENPLDDPLNELDDVSDDEALEGGSWVTPLGHVGDAEGVASTEVVRTLEQVARGGERKKPRHLSAREEEWIERLVQKHGYDYAGMFRDRKLNVMQQSEGDIKRRVKKWLARKDV